VSGFELDGEKVKALNEGRSYIEDVSAEEIGAPCARGGSFASADFAGLAECDVINVCVPTPLTKTKDPDVSFIVRAVEDIRKRLRGGQLLILGSTTYPGTTTTCSCRSSRRPGSSSARLRRRLRARAHRPRQPELRLKQVPKVVGGETPVCTKLAVQVYEAIFDKVVAVSSSQSAEMVKLLENTFRAINIGLANEVALMCNRLGLDVWEVIDAARRSPTAS